MVEYKSIGTHWIAFYANADHVTYFDSFGVKYILKQIKKFIDNKNITIGVHKIQANDSIMCRFFSSECIGFILKDKSLLD